MAGERADQLPGRSTRRPSVVFGSEAIEGVTDYFLGCTATPVWPPPGARSDSLRVTEFTVSTSLPSSPVSPFSAVSAAGNEFDFCGPSPNVQLEHLPQEVLSRICAVAITTDSNTRPTLQATSKLLRDTVCSTPDAWDTFEVMTGTPRSLTTPPQVAQHIQRSRARPLSVALTVARAQDEQDEQEPENAQGIIESVVEAAARIEDLILDVHCDASEHALIRLFVPSIPSILRRLALVGKLQLDYILSSLSSLSSLTPPVFSSLRHLTIAYCPIYSLHTTITTVHSLKLGVTFLAPHPSGGSLVGLLRAFPSLRTLELHTLTYAPGYNPRICPRDSNGNDAVLQLPHLHLLVLDSVPLDCEVFASLRSPHLRKLVLKHVLPECTGGWDTTQRFDEFVARQDWAHLQALEVDGVYQAVRDTCIELVKMAEGRLKELTLGGFAWESCKALMTPGPLATPDTPEPSTFPIQAVVDAPRLFPALERLVVRLDDTEIHHQRTRQAWMDGLQQFALGRIAYDTVADVLFRGYQNAPAWLQALGQKAPSWRLACKDGLKDYPVHVTRCLSPKIEGSTRTLTHISLETSFHDSYAFIWNEYEQLKDIYDISV